MNEKRYKLTLPIIAMSVNQCYKIGRTKSRAVLMKSKDAVVYQQMIQWTISSKLGRIEPLLGEVGIKLKFYMPSHKGDGDNLLKPLLDAFQGFLYKNDRQIKHYEIDIFKDRGNERIEVEVWLLDQVVV